MNMASSSSAVLACSLKSCLLLHGTISLTLSTAHFLLQDKKLKVFSETQSGPFGQRSHYLWAITDECGIAASHFRKLSDKLIKESGYGLR